MNRPRDRDKPGSVIQPWVQSLAGWLSRKGSSLGPYLNSLQERLEFGAIHPRSCLAELDEEQAETVRRLALAALVVYRQANEEEEPTT